MKFKRVHEEDVPELISMATEIYNDYFTTIFPQEQVDILIDMYFSEHVIRESLETGDNDYFFIVDGEKKLGYYVVSPHKGSVIIKLYFNRESRGHGYSKQALKLILKGFKVEGYKKVYIAVDKRNDLAVHAFLKRGFDISHFMKVDLSEGYYLDLCIMEKSV